jgi:hypothetical protein
LNNGLSEFFYNAFRGHFLSNHDSGFENAFTQVLSLK